MKKIFTTFIILFIITIFIPKKILAQTSPVCNATKRQGECSSPESPEICPEGALLIWDSSCTTNFACCGEQITPPDPEPVPIPDPVPTEDTPPAELESTEIDIFKGPDNAFLDSLNPLKMGGGNTDIATQLSTPGGIVSRLLQFLFPIAGLILFLMLVWGGFEILVKSTQGTKGIEAGKNRITAAIVGFLLLFATYWMAQIIEVIFGIVIV